MRTVGAEIGLAFASVYGTLQRLQRLGLVDWEPRVHGTLHVEPDVVFIQGEPYQAEAVAWAEPPGHWVPGTGWLARRCDLPLGARYRQVGGRYNWRVTRQDERSAEWTHEVIVLSWPASAS